MGHVTFDKVLSIILISAFILVGSFFAWKYAVNERIEYVFDSALYFDKFIQKVEQLKQNPSMVIPEIYESIRIDDYNDSGSLLLLPIGFLFGTSRQVFVTAIWVVYGGLTTVSCFFLYLTLWKVSSNSKICYSLISIHAITACLMYSYLFISINYGFWAISGLPIILLCYSIFIRLWYRVDNRWITYLLLGILLPISFIVRRWYAFWLVTFFLVLIGSLLIRAVIRKDRNEISKIITLSFLSMIVTFALTAPVLQRIITTDYSDIYSYQRPDQSYLDFYNSIIFQNGYLGIGLMFIGLILLLKASVTRSLMLLIAIQTALTIGLFIHTQKIGNHQIYIYTSLFLLSWFSWLKYISINSSIRKLAALLLLVSLSAYQYITIYINPQLSNIGNLFSQEESIPQQRTDLNEYWKLLGKMNQLLGNEKVYILSSNFDTFHFNMVNRSLRIRYPNTNLDNLIIASDADKRDGFPINFFEAKYIYVADPIWIRSGYQPQLVLTEIPDALNDSNRLGKFFKKNPTYYQLEQGIRVYEYEKIRPIESIDMNNLLLKFKETYPNYPQLWQFNVENLHQ